VVPAEVIEERRQRKQAIRGDNAERKQRTPDQRRDERPQRGRGPRDRDLDESNTVVGFGDDMPAFMRVVAKV
jgi:hypothetical protein